MCATYVLATLFMLPLLSYAALTSSNFVIESPTIGNVGGTNMSSTNFSLTPRSGDTYTTSGTDSVDDEDNNDDSQGSGTKVKKKPNVQQIISAIVNTEHLLDGENQKEKSFAAHYNSPLVAETEASMKKLETDSTSLLETQDTDTDEYNASLLASLISGDFKKVADVLGETYSSLFSHFAARAVFFIWVLAFLYFIRVNTGLGRKYSPF